jgi:glutathione S-transferase
MTAPLGYTGLSLKYRQYLVNRRIPIMKRTVYELAGKDDRRFSPFCWRTRMALAHKGLSADYEPCGFTEKDKIAFAEYDRFPVLVDGDEIVTDSWNIACYLEDTYPDEPSLFRGDGGKHMAYFMNCWTDTQLHPAILRTIIFDVFEHINDADTAFFRTDREARFKQTLEEMDALQEAHAKDLDQVLVPLRSVLAKQDWFGGDTPAYGDYIVFGALQWPRCVSPFPIIKPNDRLYAWRNQMIGLFDKAADSVPHYDY